MAKGNYSGKVLTREEADVVVRAVQEKVLIVLEDNLLSAHQRGEMDAESVIYAATSALCELAAFMMFEQLEDPSEQRVERMIASYCKMFELKARSVIDWRNRQEQKDTSEDIPLAPTGTEGRSSMWD